MNPDLDWYRFAPLDTDIRTALSDVTGAAYDGKAKLYEKLVANRVYNRVVWGTTPDDYKRFAEEAVESGEGPLLDAGCGGLVQTADLYRHAARPCWLVDHSRDMLRIGRDRLLESDGTVPGHLHLLQADAFALPFADATFDTVCGFGMLHLFDDKAAYLREVLRTLKPGGSYHFSTMTTERGFGRFFMNQLRKRGEFGQPLSEAQTLDLFFTLGLHPHHYRIGNMLFISG